MAMLEARAQKIAEEETGVAKLAVGGTGIKFVRGAVNVVESNVTENPEEIDIGDDDGDDEQRNLDGKFLYDLKLNIKISRNTKQPMLQMIR